MATYYTTDETGKILETAQWKFKDDCLETEREIIRGYDGQLYFAGEEPEQPPPTPEEIQKTLTDAVQAHLDTKANERGYDNIHTACTYANSTDQIFQAEALAYIAWRDSVWRTCYNILNEVTTGQREIPTAEELLAELPELVWPEIE